LAHDPPLETRFVQVIFPKLPVQVVPASQSDVVRQAAPQTAFFVVVVVVVAGVVVLTVVVVVGLVVVFVVVVLTVVVVVGFVVVVVVVVVGGEVVAGFTHVSSTHLSPASQIWHDLMAQDPISWTLMVQIFLPFALVQE
jgi:cytochrome c biogenesis protein CcdA